jgi:hypothetical protein
LILRTAVAVTVAVECEHDERSPKASLRPEGLASRLHGQRNESLQASEAARAERSEAEGLATRGHIALTALEPRRSDLTPNYGPVIPS